MMKTSDEILLEEVKAEYTRQLSHWDELDRKSYNFLQLNGLLLSMIFIGISSTIESIDDRVFPLLFISAFFIILSLLMITSSVIRVTIIKDIKIDLDDKNDLKNKEQEIILSLFKVYDIAQKDVISKHNIRVKNLALSTKFLFIGLLSLLLFIYAISLLKIIY